MKKLTSMPFEYDDDTNKTKLKELWGDSLNKLTPKQRQLVVEILSNLNVLSSASHLSFEMSAFVQEVRLYGHASIQQRCGIMRVLNMSQPLKLNDIYTNVNVLKKISGRRRLEVADLLKTSVSDKFERPQLGRIATERMNGLEAVKKYDKLIVLGKPGSGKTTFLKHVALQCSSGELQANRVPIFITLKDFAETQHQPSLLEYITEQLSKEAGANTLVAEQLLSQGQMLILLDGLDEVRETDSHRVMKSVRNFAAQFHSNHFVIACRIAAQEYTFEQFTQVKIADFDSEQIATLVTLWFQALEPVLAKKFIQKLQENSAIQELATCPLLLMMLCLVFEESGSFPDNRSELYKEGLDILLKKWDALRDIERPVYKKLSVQQKEDILSQIALMTFERGEYFFRQQEIELHIADYIRNLPAARIDFEALQLESSAVLKSIEAHHGLLVERARGIYSFSHLTFHEYFTAREIVASSAPQALGTALKRLAGRITDKRWREVFLLTCGMLRSADYLLQLMKRHIDELVAGDEQLQAFLCSVSQKSRAVPAPYQPVTVRAFYLDLELARTLDLVGGTLAYDLDHALVSGTLTNDLAMALALVHDRDLTLTLAHVLAHDRALSLTLDRDLDRTLALALALVHNHAITLDRAITLELTLELALTLDRALAHHRVLAPDLERELKQLKAQLPDLDKDTERFPAWWKAFGGAWTEKLRAVMIKHRHIGHNWRFSKTQQDKLRQYYDTNKLLVDCLNSDCYVSRAVRDEISETLLLPLKEPVREEINQWLGLAASI